MFKEFKEYDMRGNVVDVAVGIVIGAAFTSIVKALPSAISVIEREEDSLTLSSSARTQLARCQKPIRGNREHVWGVLKETCCFI